LPVPIRLLPELTKELVEPPIKSTSFPELPATMVLAKTVKVPVSPLLPIPAPPPAAVFLVMVLS